MALLLDEDELLEHFQELHLIRGMEEEVSSVDDFSREEVDRQNRHDEDVCLRKRANALRDEEDALAMANLCVELVPHANVLNALVVDRVHEGVVLLPPQLVLATRDYCSSPYVFCAQKVMMTRLYSSNSK